MARKKIPLITLVKCGIIPALVVFLTTFFSTYDFPLELFPQNETFFEYSTVSDGNFEDGNSVSSVDTSNKHLEFNYTLGEKNETPYAQLLFHAHQLFRSINLKKYRAVEIVILPEETSDFTLTLYTYVPNFSDPGNSDTHRPYSLICRPYGEKNISLQLSSFATPGWWFSAFQVGEEDVPSSDWGKITHLSISDASRKKGEPLQIIIEQLRFVDSVSEKMGIAFVASLLYMVLFFIIYERMRISKNRKIKQRLYHPGSRTSFTEDEKESLLSFLHENFSDPLLTLEKIEKQLGLNQFQVNEIVAQQYKLRYKQYLNKIRIEKAKELLTTTDSPISAIAEEVGYCYSNSFSRAFRQSEDITPNQFRKMREENA